MAKFSRALRTGALGGLLLASTALTAPAFGQSAPPPAFNQVDGNGVDLVTGDFFWSMTEGTIGAGAGALSLVRNWAGPAGWTDNWSGALYSRTTGATTRMIVEFGTYSDAFSISGGTYTSTKADGATLEDLGSGLFRYTASDGTQIDFSALSGSGYQMTGPVCQRATDGTCAIPAAIRQPSGMTYTLNWDVEERCFEQDEEFNCVSSGAYPRFRGVSNSANYAFTIGYATNTPGSGVPASNWFVRTGAQFTNLDSAPGTLPTVTYSAVSSTVTDVTDIGGQTWRLTNGSAGRLTGVRRPGAGSDTTTISYSSATVAAVTNEGVATTYAWSDEMTAHLATVTDAASGVTEVRSDPSSQRITSVTDPLSRVTTFAYDTNGRLERSTMPEGNSAAYTYDARGNITETRLREKDDDDDTGDDIVTTASYDSTCSNPVTCNLPNSVTDARGHTTDFTYDATHGGMLTVTAPAPSGSGDRPQRRYAYAQFTAVTGEPVYMVTGVSSCSSGTAAGSPSCVGTANEARTVTAYDTDNLRVTSVTARNGSNTISTASAFTYDQLGNLLTVDGPVSGSGDTTRFRYDAARRVIGTIGPDPDGGGARKHGAERRTYTNGMLTKVEIGTVDSQSDGDWAAFSPAQRVEQDYDAHARPIQQRLMSGSTTYAVSQSSYDALGRPYCVAQRMNRNEFASLTADACALDTQGTGADDFGPDRITRRYYDAAGQLTQIRGAYAVSGQEASVATMTYRDNGQLEFLTDAEGHVTRYYYDVFDRLWHVYYPNASTGAVNYDDYERYSYDAAGNVIGFRRRGGASIGFQYDYLNRTTEKDAEGAEPAVAYTYDLMGRLLTAATASPAHTLTFTWDALGRNLTQDGPQGTATHGYDAAGRPSTLTYPGGGLVIGYSYDIASRLTQIDRDPAGTPAQLAAYAYDDLGRRTGTTRGNGAATAYTYDAVSRLTQIVQNLDGTTYDLTLDYGYNPAGQIVSTVRSNDAYAWGGHYAVTRSYTANGLNQYSAAGSASLTYGDRGNLATTPGPGVSETLTFAYDSENLLTGRTSNGSSPTVSLSYDPATRLYETAGGTTTRMAYDGDNMIAEYNGSNALQRRYVFGPGGEPLVRYDGSGTSTPSYYHADERGSVIATSDGSGAMATINSYDEYGIPASGNSGRFQYTGQQWLAELGMQYSRARIYSPTLGRFMQTDPIGVSGGMNLYGYVNGDPVNMVDPSGLDGVTCLTNDENCTDFSVDGPSGDGGDECDYGRVWDADPRHLVLCYASHPPISGLVTNTAYDAPGVGGGVDNPSNPACVSAGTRFETAAAAGVAGARLADHIRREANDGINEYGGRITALPGGGYTFTQPMRGGDGTFTTSMPPSTPGWYHIHNQSYGSQLSHRENNRDRPRDRETALRFVQGGNSTFTTVLGAADTGRVYSWRGGSRLGNAGHDEGPLRCHMP